MKFHIAGRRVGKSHQLLQWFLSTPNSVIVVPDMSQKADLLHYLLGQLNDVDVLKEYEARIYTLSERDKLRGRRAVVGIDNVDMILYYLFGNVERVTATGETI